MSKKDSNKKVKNELKEFANALRFQVNWKAKTVYPAMTDEIQARLESEMQWIIENGLQHGFLQLKEICDAAKAIVGSDIAPDHGPLGGSAVAYCLGITGADPIIEGRTMTEMESPAPQNINVSIHFDPEKRNEVVTWTENKYGEKAMTRMGVYIFKLDRVILEYHRNMKDL